MDSLPVPALPADPAPPPPAPRQASDDRGFADALRAAHRDGERADRGTDRKPATGRGDAAHSRKNEPAARRHGVRRHDDSQQDPTTATVAVTTTNAADKPPSTVVSNGTILAATANPAATDATEPATTPVGAIGDDPTAVAGEATGGKTATSPSGNAADFAVAVHDAADKVARTKDGAAAKAADDGKIEKPPHDVDQDRRKTDAEPTLTAAVVPTEAPPADTGVKDAKPAASTDASTTAAAAVEQSAATPARPGALPATPATKAKPTENAGKPSATAAATGNADGRATAGQAAEPDSAEDVASAKPDRDGAKKDEVADDKHGTADPATPPKADAATNDRTDRTTVVAPQTNDNQPGPANAPSHQAAPVQNVTTPPGAGVLTEVRPQTSLQAPQAQPSAASTTPQLPPPATDQVAVEIGRAVHQGKDHFSLELHPADLGRISVDLQLGSDHRVVAVIHAEHRDTLQLLQRDSQALQRALQDAGLQTDSGSLSFNLRGEGGGSQRSFADLAGDSRPIAVPAPLAAAEAAARLARPWRFGDTGIDIRV